MLYVNVEHIKFICQVFHVLILKFQELDVYPKYDYGRPKANINKVDKVLKYDIYLKYDSNVIT